MLGSGQVTITLKTINDLSDRKDLFKAVTWLGDFAANGRSAAGVLVAGATSGQFCTILLVGRTKVSLGAASSVGNAMTVAASGFFTPMSAGAFEIGTLMGQDGADKTSGVNCSWAAAIVNFANKPFANTLASSAGQGAFI